ncbi:RagB/SusD family nutrient uptake outer membrane protein [Haliscomenobacter hydrossis]|uniref:RagB/SusD domain-containing protein n=1 Tax=Haliscomenobacter hydrossis (strain ATCC 27775 / DSM 1100 / LMG 10767 / O) TaxID=760192 RepID=F4KQT6_HALH1|nr:RagB/SusD family nutrient uptake outer membrane protein [Haliscomenobacter hydrossis]AEE52221.1 RagB/SusD domain-containing protein [Haliscomenobacter hydrossis DSM 1100]
MKRNILIFTLILSLASCSDFLEPDSLSTFDSKYVFSNVDDARKGVNAAYVQFGTDGFRSRLSNNMAGNTDIERQSGWSSSSDRYQIWNLDALSTNGDLRQFWNAAYTSIRDANIAIEGIESSGSLESNDAQTKRLMYNMLGEVYTLRAYWYSMLIYFFGDVPNVRLAPKAGVDFYLPRENRNVILTQLIDDLKAIEDKMLWADQCQYGTEQVNREFTLGMIARLALQRGGYYLKPDMTMVREGDYKTYYQIAKDYTGKLISLKDRPLPTDYRQVFLNQNKFVTTVNSEVLFEVPFALGNGDVGWNIGITVQGGATASHAYGSGNNYMAIPMSYYFSFDTTDIRRDVTCALYQVNTKFEEEFASANNIAQGKWSRYFLPAPQGQNSAKGTGINWPMLRYADVLLMYAEAENELNGPTAEAKNAFKRVRQRAFSSSLWAEKVDAYTDSRSGSKEEFFNAIVDERGWEFGGEMIRKYELIRWGIYSKKMQETVNTLKEMVDGAIAGTGKYANLPDYMYWKRNAAGKFTLLNPNTKVTGVPDPSWTRVPFTRAMYDATKMTYSEFVTKDWEPYYNGPVPGVARYIFPVPEEAVSASQGKVDNNGYMFK